MSRRFAAIDCGTNSVRLLVVEQVEGRMVELDRRLHITRLGQGVDATGRFHPDALARTLAAMSDFGTQLDDLGVGRRRVVATSAARDAQNSAEFFDGVLQRVGVPAEIISGEEEARLSYRGARAAVSGLDEPVLVMDIGGGSTELVLGSGKSVQAAVSLPMGSVRLRERFLASDPPSTDQVLEAVGYTGELIGSCGVDLATAAAWVGVGGTATSLSAITQGLEVYDRARVHDSVVSKSDLESLAEQLLSWPVARVTELPTMVPGRADVICAGALIAREIARRVGTALRVSEADILDGIVADLV